MTKKDYIILAEAIRLATDTVDSDYIHAGALIPHLVCELKKENPNFDGFKFISACSK